LPGPTLAKTITNHMHILVVEDEPILAQQVRRALERAGHQVETAHEGPAAVETAAGEHFDLVVLDVNLPGCNGFEVLEHLRHHAAPPRVLMLTARAELENRVRGLQAGADDYLTKPFAMEELLARIEALGRRGAAADSSEGTLGVGGLSVNVAKRRVSQGGERIDLSPREFEVLHILMQEPERVFSRDEICGHVWEREHEYDTRTVEIFIMRIRKKLDPALAKAKIETVRGVGYVLRTLS
jgi:DNA-binding response OmpR family regulator